MTNHPYPPLPGEQFCAWMYRGDSVNAFDRPASQVSDPYFKDKGYTAEPLFTAAQMQAYVDADRAQRKPLTDEQVFDALPGGLMDCLNDPWDEGHGDGDTMRSLRKDVMRVVRTVEALQGINPPPRPDAGNN